MALSRLAKAEKCMSPSFELDLSSLHRSLRFARGHVGASPGNLPPTTSFPMHVPQSSLIGRFWSSSLRSHGVASLGLGLKPEPHNRPHNVGLRSLTSIRRASAVAIALTRACKAQPFTRHSHSWGAATCIVGLRPDSKGPVGQAPG